MKKFAMLLAAGVIALGASAQAASVASADTYAVITIPVYPGNNLIGVSVLPMADVQSPVLTDVTTLAKSQSVKGINAAGTDYTNDEYANVANAEVGDVYWYTSAVATNLYEFGKEPDSATSVSLSGLDMAVVTVPSAWTFADVEGTFTGGSRPSKADKIHVWNPQSQGYDAYWKTGSGWVKYADGTSASSVTNGAAQGFFFEVKNPTTAIINP